MTNVILYDEFIKRKASEDVESGFEPSELGAHLFDFQSAIVEWACKRGRVMLTAQDLKHEGQQLAKLGMSDGIIRFYGHNLEAAMQAGNRAHALFWQAKMYAAIKARNSALGAAHA